MIASKLAGTPFSLQDLWWLVPVLILVGGGVLLSAAAWYGNRPVRRAIDGRSGPGAAGPIGRAGAAWRFGQGVDRPPRPIILGAAGVLSAALLWAALLPPHGDLLRYPSSVGVEHSLPSDVVLSVGIPLPLNTTGKDVRLRSVRLEGLAGATVHGMGIHDPRATNLGVGTAEGFPPAGVRLTPVEGAVLGADRSSGWTLDIVVGISRDPGADPGSFAAALIEYEMGGRLYRVRAPFSVTIHDPDLD